MILFSIIMLKQQLTSYIDDYDDFKLTSKVFYDTYVSNYPTKYKSTYVGDQMNLKMIKKELQFSNDFDLEQVPETIWLKAYYKIRLLESGSRKDNNSIKRDLKTVLSVYNRKGLFFALQSMESMLTKLNSLAFPKNREKKFDYGELDINSAIYKKKDLSIQEISQLKVHKSPKNGNVESVTISGGTPTTTGGSY